VLTKRIKLRDNCIHAISRWFKKEVRVVGKKTEQDIGAVNTQAVDKVIILQFVREDLGNEN
jgi:hypothetical protein